METREEEENWWVPRGGPIYLPNMVAPLTRVPDFQSSLLLLLQELEAELPLDSQELDISVDDLKVYTEEELTDMAVKETFWDQHNSANSSKQPSLESSSQHPSGSKPKKKKKRKTGKETGRRTRVTSKPLFDEAFLAKVERLAEIKKRQDEERAAAKLHSLSDTHKTDERAAQLSNSVKRMKSLRCNDYATKVKSSDAQEPLPVLYPEVVLCVEVYHNIRKTSKTQEFLVLGNQMLGQLRDKIDCVTDQVMQKAGQYNPSGYFLIEDIFCNYLRDSSCVDYSKPMLDWLRDSKDEALRKWECILTGELKKKQKAVLGEVKPMDLPQFRAADMHKTRFCDLRFRLGAGYLYCHQGNCKHMIVIRDMRLIHPEDIHNRAVYPRVMFRLKPRVQKCSVCKIYRAAKIAVDDKWAMENPCYFCDYCYSLLHSEDGPLYSDFPVYDYLHD